MELWPWEHRIPKKIISDNDYFYIWMSNDYEYLLVVENWELRIYSYEYWSEDSILDGHQWEDWRDYLYYYFQWMLGCFDKNIMRYSTLNIKWKEAFNIAKEIINWADINMVDDVNWELVEDNDRRSKVPSSSLISFIERALSKTGEKIYCYYK